MNAFRALPRTALVAAAFLAPAFAADSAQWPRWRGPHDNGTTISTAKLPTQLDVARLRWKAPLPGKGTSTPIVWNQRIYVTAPVDGSDAVLAYDWAGQKLWHTTFGAEDKGKHRNASGCNPSPSTDGRALFVSFKSGTLAALTLDGKIKWQTNLVERFGRVNMYWDYGTSPTLTAEHVVVARMHDGESWLAAFDKETGELRWKTPRNYEVPREVDQCYTTPLVIRHEGREAVLTWGAEHVTLHEAATGKLLSSCGKFGGTTFWPAVATPVVAGDVAVVCFGRADKGAPRLHGVKLGGSGDVTAQNHLWSRDEVSAFVPSPAEYQGRVYLLGDRGNVACVDPATGRTIWNEALPRASANYYASPLIVAGVMYMAREDGALFVAQIDGGFKLLGESKLADRVIASPIAVGDRLLVRGEANLYCW